MFANRNGFYYTLDRTTGKLIVAKPFVNTTWAKEIDSTGRPILLPGHEPDEKGEVTCPDITGGTNFWPPTFDPSTRTFFVNAREVCMTFYAWKPEYEEGSRFTGGAGQRARGPDMPVYGALRAIDPATGQRKWTFPMYDLTDAGVLTTASDVLFTGGRDGYFYALDARSGSELWKTSFGSVSLRSSPMTYEADGKQFVAVIGGHVLAAYGLRE